MTRETLIQRTLTVLSKLPQDKAIEIADFADYIFKKYNDESPPKRVFDTNCTNHFLKYN